MRILEETDAAINKEEYWFFRADINIVMMFLRVRVSSFVLACDAPVDRNCL